MPPKTKKEAPDLDVLEVKNQYMEKRLDTLELSQKQEFAEIKLSLVSIQKQFYDARMMEQMNLVPRAEFEKLVLMVQWQDKLYKELKGELSGVRTEVAKYIGMATAAIGIITFAIEKLSAFMK